MATCTWPNCEVELPLRRYENGHTYQPKYCDPHRREKAVQNGRGKSPSDRRIDRGYVLLRREVEGRTVWIPEHREIMESVIGRPLRKGEQVVHLNGERDDNRPQNLGLRTVLTYDELQKPLQTS